MLLAATKTDPEAIRQDREFAQIELEREAQEIRQIQKKELEPQVNGLNEEREAGRSNIEQMFLDLINGKLDVKF